MKKALIIIVAIILSQNINGQNYNPFPTDTANWDCLMWHQWSPSDIILTNTEYTLQGDTSLNGISYNKVYYTETDIQSITAIYIGGIREDSIKNIYFFPNSVNLPTIGHISFPNDTSEHLLYTFDSLYIGKSLPINVGNTTIMVSDMDSVLIGSNYRKRYKIMNSNLLGADYWIEGIGSIKDLLIPYSYEHEWQYYTLCFSDTTTYHINAPNGADSCHYSIPLGLSEIKTNKPVVYPNPASESLLIDVGNKNGIINIYNSQGQIVIKDIEVESKIKIEVDKLKPGLYIIELYSNKEKVYTKFIKK